MWALLSCALLVIHTTTAEMQYLVFAPPILKSNQTGKVCMEVIGISEPTDMKVTLQLPNFPNNVSFFDEILQAGEFRKCKEMPIPSVDFPTLATLNVISGNRSNQRNVVVNGVKPFCVGQMEKQIYKPGETIRCRVTCLNGNLRPYPQTVTAFEVSDPSGNVVKRETNVEMQDTFAMFSYRIPSEPSYGFYQLRAILPSETVFMSSEVKRYVLPTFDADLKAPSSISSIDPTIEMGVSGSYTYGQSLGAKVEMSVCRKPNQFGPVGTCNLNPNGICRLYAGYLKPDGSFNVTVDLQQFQINQRGLDDSLTIEATITENGTDVQVFKSANVYISRQMHDPYFNYQVTDTCYRQGINTTGSLILQDGNKGIRDQSIALYIASENVANCVTDENGNCNFSFDTSKYMVGSLILEARYDQNRQCFDSSPSWTGQPNNYPQLTLPRCYSPSGSFLKIKPVEGEQPCGQSVTIEAECILNRTSLLPRTDTVTATYKVMARSDVKSTGEVEFILGSDGKGYFSFTFSVTPDSGPTATAMATVLMGSGEVVGHHTTLQVQRCFENKVNVTFSPEKVRPGSNVSITVEAAPGSSCAFSAKDAGVNILSPDNGLSWSSMVYNRIPYVFSSGSWVDGFSLAPNQFVPCTDMPDIVLEGVNYQATSDVNNAVDWQQDILNSVGLITICGNCKPKPNVCPKPNNCPPTSPTPIRPVPFETTLARGNVLTANDGAFAGKVVESVRTNFPETWMYEIVKVDSAGRADLSRLVPDSITEWVADVPCNSDTSGFGALDEPRGLIVFQDFFVDFTMAPTLVQGEECILKITAFNYLTECTRVDLTLAPSKDYKAHLISVENEFCICQYERTTASFIFSALALGTINITVTAATNPNNTCGGANSDIQYKDTVIKPLVVFAEGLPQEETQGALLCSKDGPVSQSINVDTHPQVVNGSARIIVSCVGDPIGLSAQYLDDLFQMPSGCGEQTLSMLRSNLFIRENMNITGKLDQAFKEKSDYYIANGVGNAWKFRTNLGCLSTWQSTFSSNFWTQTSCSLWLTCLGLVTLTTAKDYTYVDPSGINQLNSWITSQQDPISGAFLTDGNSYNQILESNITISAYVAISLLEYAPEGSQVVNRVLDFLSTQVDRMDNKPLEMAMTSYAFILANNTETSNRLMEKLKAYEITGDDGLFLKDPSDQTSGDTLFFPWTCNSATNLLNAYYALCLLRSGADLAKLLPIMRFLVKQMNGHGGFCSSQDTAPALQALIELLPRIYTMDGTNTVDIQSGGNSIAQFTVNPSNSMVLQQTDTLPLPGAYELSVNGNGCVYCQTTVKYNIEPENMKQTFSVDVQISPGTCENGDVKKLDINITMSYTGQNNASNMALVDVQLLSGFQPMESNLTALVNEGRINQYDLTKMGHVTMYINRISKDSGSVAFTMIETTSVQNRKAAMVHVSDYYKRDEMGSAQYAHPCSISSNEA